MEGINHLGTVTAFLQRENADILTLMEAPESLGEWLKTQGYTTSFAAMTIKSQHNTTFTEGLLLATKLPHTASSHYYRGTQQTIQNFDRTQKVNTIAHAVLYGQVGPYHIATTHFTWNPTGETADTLQKKEMSLLLEITKKLPAHILCGDMNIPRGLNELYDILCEHYSDNIPLRFASSLDRTLHRAGNNPQLTKLFDSFMVDYIFTQPPYTTKDVRLEFGISDHAAVIAIITQAEW